MLITKPTPEADSFVLGGTANIKLETNSRVIAGLAIQAIGTGPAAAELDLSTVIENIIIEQDTKQKIFIKPALQRKLDNVLNSNSDTLSPSFAFIPFLRMGISGSGWGTANIGQLLARIKLVAALPANTTFTAIKGHMAHIPVSQAVNRGSVYVQTVVTTPNTIVAGWNAISDLPYYGITNLTKLLLDSPAVTEVKILLGDKVVYHQTLAAMKFALMVNPLYKVPAGINYFPVMLDALGNPGDFLPLFENGVRQNLRVEFYYDTGIAAAAPFDILAEGVERDDSEKVAVATTKA